MARISMKEALAELEARGATIIEAPPTLAAARMILQDLGPQKVGGRYLCGYWGETYEVLAIAVDGWRWSITVRWGDGRTATHSTSWDRRWDREI